MVATAASDRQSRDQGLFPDERLAPTAALLGANIAVHAAFERLANGPAGLDAETANLLVRIATSPHGSLRGVDISQQLKINATRVSRLVDRAEAAGIIARLPDPNDRRAQRLVLTELGVETARRFAPLMDALLESMIYEEFDDGELKTFVGLLDRLRDRATLLVEHETS